MIHDMRLLEMNAILADRIRGTRRHQTANRVVINRCRIPMLIQIIPLHRQGRLFLRINPGRMQTITNTQLTIIQERRSRAESLPLMLQRGSRLVLRPYTEIRSRKMLKIMPTFSKLAGMPPAIEQIKDMVTTFVEESHHVTHPSVMIRRRPILDIRIHKRLRSDYSLRLESRLIQSGIAYDIRI